MQSCTIIAGVDDEDDWVNSHLEHIFPLDPCAAAVQGSKTCGKGSKSTKRSYCAHQKGMNKCRGKDTILNDNLAHQL